MEYVRPPPNSPHVVAGRPCQDNRLGCPRTARMSPSSRLSSEGHEKDHSELHFGGIVERKVEVVVAVVSLLVRCGVYDLSPGWHVHASCWRAVQWLQAPVAARRGWKGAAIDWEILACLDVQRAFEARHDHDDVSLRLLGRILHWAVFPA